MLTFTFTDFTTINYFHCYHWYSFLITHIFNFLQHFTTFHKLPKNYTLSVKYHKHTNSEPKTESYLNWKVHFISGEGRVGWEGVMK